MTRQVTVNLMDISGIEIRNRLRPLVVYSRLRTRGYARFKDSRQYVRGVRTWTENVGATELEAAFAFRDEVYRKAYYEVDIRELRT